MKETEVIEILKKQEEEFYQEIKEDAQKEIDAIHSLGAECLNALLANEIYIVNNETLFNKTVIGKESAISLFNKLIDSLSEEEDIKNAHVTIREEQYEVDKDNGFRVFYPQYQREDIKNIEVQVINSVSQFIEKVIYDKKTSLNKKVFYRGQANWAYNLLPGIYREKNRGILEHESEYIKEIVSSYPQYFNECKTALDFLAVLQHNGFPTRLLDFSENPLISLYMACSSKTSTHADTMKIAVEKIYFKYYDSDTISILANLAMADDSFDVSDFRSTGDREKDIEAFNKREDITKLVHVIRNEKPYFKGYIWPEDLEGKILFVKPKQHFDRIAHQSGLFAIFGISSKKEIVPRIDEVITPFEVTHYIIPSELKEKILAELSLVNITEASVYCDLEHVAKHYVNRANNNNIISHIIEQHKKQEYLELKNAFSS